MRVGGRIKRVGGFSLVEFGGKPLDHEEKGDIAESLDVCSRGKDPTARHWPWYCWQYHCATRKNTPTGRLACALHT